MAQRSLRVLLLCLLVGTALAAPPAEAKSVYGKVLEVWEANLLLLDHGAGTYVLRLRGIDAPVAQAPFALEARLFVEGKVRGKQVRARIERRIDGDEMEAMLLVDGEDVGLALLRNGLARRAAGAHYKAHGDGRPDDLVAAEREGREAHRGLWLHGGTVSEEQGASAGDVGTSEATEAVEQSGSSDQNASQLAGIDNECAMAQDPSNPQRLFQACNTNVDALFAARSVDGGETWTYPDPTDKRIADGDAGQGATACCDPTLAWDRFGNLFVTYINSAVNAVVTLLSTDGGQTFTQIASFSGSVDQPTVVVSSVGTDAHVWVVWNSSGSMVARGALVTGLGSVGAFGAVQTAPSTSGCNFGDIAVSPTGVVVQVCEVPSGGQGPANVRTNVDADGLGAGGFGAIATATTTNVGGFDFIPAQPNRSVDAEAGLAYDAFPSSPHFGRLYLVYTEEPTNENNDTNILLRYSDDNATTWSTAIRVDDDTTTRSQFLPKIATDPTTGNIGVCWHDARGSASNNAAVMYCATASSSTTTPTFSRSIAVSDGASISPSGSPMDFGDYTGLAFVDGVVHPAWGDSSNSTGNNPDGSTQFDAYTDRLSALGVVFSDGFETGLTTRWSRKSP